MDDTKLAGKKPNISPTWKILMKDVDLGEPTSFLDHVYLDCPQRECQISKYIVDNYRSMFEFQLVLWKSYQKLKLQGNLRHSVHGPMTWKVMRRTAWKDVANLRKKQLSNYTKVATPCMDGHQFREEEIGSVGEFSTVCSQIALKCLYLACIGRPDILWSVNKLARAVTKWTKACDKRLARLISYIITQVNLVNIGMWATQHNNAEWNYFKILILQETWKTQSQHQVDFCVFFRSQTFVPTKWMCKKQTSVSHSSTVRGSYSARVPRSSLARVRRVLVPPHHGRRS